MKNNNCIGGWNRENLKQSISLVFVNALLLHIYVTAFVTIKFTCPYYVSLWDIVLLTSDHQFTTFFLVPNLFDVSILYFFTLKIIQSFYFQIQVKKYDLTYKWVLNTLYAFFSFSLKRKSEALFYWRFRHRRMLHVEKWLKCIIHIFNYISNSI